MLKIAELRKEIGLKQMDLAKSLNISVKKLGAWEQNRAEPNILDLIKLSDFFGVSIDELVNRTNVVGIVEVKNDLSEEENSLVQSFRKMNSAEKAVLNGYAEMITKTHKGEVENKKFN